MEISDATAKLALVADQYAIMQEALWQTLGGVEIVVYEPNPTHLIEFVKTDDGKVLLRRRRETTYGEDDDGQRTDR